MGTLLIERFNGNELYNISSAKVRVMKKNSYLETLIEVKTDLCIKNLSDTSTLKAEPTAEIMFKVSGSDMNIFNKFSTYIPEGFSTELKEYITTFYYCSHQMMDKNQITLTCNSDNVHKLKWTATIMDVNYYDGSVSDAKINIETDVKIIEDIWTCIDDLNLVKVINNA